MQHELDFNTAKTRDYIMSHCFGTEYSVDDILPFSSSWTLYMLRVEENLLAADEFLATFDDDDEIENQNESRQADVMEEKCAEWNDGGSQRDATQPWQEQGVREQPVEVECNIKANA